MKIRMDFVENVSMIKKQIIILLLFSLFSCSRSGNFNKLEEIKYGTSVELHDSIGIYTIDGTLREFGGDYFIIDRSQNKVVRVDSEFQKSKFSFGLEQSMSEDFEIYSFDILEDRIFIRSRSGYTVFNLRNNKFVGFFKNPFLLSQQLLKGHDNMYSTRFFDYGLEVVKFDWNDEFGFQRVSRIVQIPTERNVSEIDQSGWLFFLGDNLVYIDEWSGEYFFIDVVNKKIINQGRLPFSGPIEENYEVDDSGVAFGTFKNAYCIAMKDQKTFYVIREVDWEISDSPEIDLENEGGKKRFRKRVHLFNSQLQLIDSFSLQDYTNCIYYHDGKLFANHTGDEKIYIYEVD